MTTTQPSVGPAFAAVPAPDGHLDDRAISPLRILGVLLRERGLVLAFSMVGLVVALVLGLLRERTYTTTFSFVPQSAQDPTRAGLASLAGQFGLPLGASSGMAQSSQLYADLLRTREVLVPIARDSFTVSETSTARQALSAFLRISGSEESVVLEKTLRALRTSIISSTVATRTTGVVSVSVRTRSPQVSLEVGKRLLQGVNEFNLVTRQSQAAEERRFTEGRLAAARVALRAAEDALVRFLRTNRQFGNSPELAFEKDRLEREVAVQQQVVAALAQNYEEARIREVRDTPVITIIERPTLAAQPDSRGRVVLVIAGTFIALCAGIFAALLRDWIYRLRLTGADPEFNSLLVEWRRLRGPRG